MFIDLCIYMDKGGLMFNGEERRRSYDDVLNDLDGRLRDIELNQMKMSTRMADEFGSDSRRGITSGRVESLIDEYNKFDDRMKHLELKIATAAGVVLAVVFLIKLIFN